MRKRRRLHTRDVTKVDSPIVLHCISSLLCACREDVSHKGSAVFDNSPQLQGTYDAAKTNRAEAMKSGKSRVQ
jgi:hypothetical protein